MFAAPPDDGYPASMEHAAVAGAPRTALLKWIEDLPEDERELGGTQAIRDAHHNPAGYADEHPMESPNDVEVALEPHLEAWDCFSCAAERTSRRLIEATPLD
ncbi:hypothetical protein LTR36_008947 [Oleoguttula mirabilis]|uniref:Uncharacterized protein n=1 Tax=Oleoguttula mirabilis TaxID=1507867 RepID=A0AAV9J705_9PEZI|nr:hypothetical protein LTR36_008947 [Oleoguttula mirabilis]